MTTTYVTGMTLVAALAAGWVAVQAAWRRSFPDPGGEPDALAGRPGCGGCRTRCRRTATCEEERR